VSSWRLAGAVALRADLLAGSGSWSFSSKGCGPRAWGVAHRACKAPECCRHAPRAEACIPFCHSPPLAPDRWPFVRFSRCAFDKGRPSRQPSRARRPWAGCLPCRGGERASRRRQYLPSAAVTAGFSPACCAAATATRACQRQRGPRGRSPNPCRSRRLGAARPSGAGPLPCQRRVRHRQAPRGPPAALNSPISGAGACNRPCCAVCPPAARASRRAVLPLCSSASS